MTSLGVWRTRLGAAGLGAALTCAWLVPAPALVRAQAPRGNNANARGNAAAAANAAAANANIPDLTQGPPNLPPTPPLGAWGEVIMANARWMVVQNHEGQQFPIATDAVGQFLIRWPASFNDLGQESLIEAIGHDMGSNVLRTDHVDLFEGSDRTLVVPKIVSLLPDNRVVTAVDPAFNRFMNGFDIGSQNLLYGWAYPTAPGELGIPGRLHVVGNAIGINPLRVSVQGNNFATALPADGGGMTITQITRGNTSFAEKGDLAYLMPTDLTTRTVTLSQVVLYKKVPVKLYRKP